jgi:hypothetical protein
MEQLSLFSDGSTAEPNKERKETFEYHDQAIEYIKKDLSARQICDRLIEQDGALSETYAQGTPKLYPKLMQYLRSQSSVVKMTEVDKDGSGHFINVDDLEAPTAILDAKFTFVEARE